MIYSFLLTLLYVQTVDCQGIFNDYIAENLKKVLLHYDYPQAQIDGPMRCDTNYPMLDCRGARFSRLVRLFLTKQTTRRGVHASIPTEIGMLDTLEELEITGLLGTIPSEIGKLTQLTRLRFFEASLTRPVPAEISAITNNCLIDSSALAAEQAGCETCRPLYGCEVYPKYDCKEMCYLLQDGEVTFDLENTTRDPQTNPNFSTQFAKELAAGRARANGETEKAEQARRPAADEETQDYTTVYLVAAVLLFVAFMSAIGAAAYYRISRSRSQLS